MHERAICESQNIGKGTMIWEFSHVFLRGAIGTDCNFSTGVLVENFERASSGDGP